MEWLHVWRQRKGLTQTQLSDKSGIDSNMISRYERNTATPTLDTVKRLALGLDITVDELLNGPSEDKVKITLVYDWSHMKEGNIDMNGNDFELILGSQGQIGLKGAGMLTSHEAIDDFLARVREQLEIALDAQVRRGAIQGA